MFLQGVVGFEDQHGGSGFKTYTSLDTNDGITHMDIAANAIRASNGLQVLDGFNRMGKYFIVN